MPRLPSLPPPARGRTAQRALALLALVCLLAGLGACGGASTTEPFEEALPLPTPPAPGGGGSTPAPVPPQTPRWDPDAAAYGRTALFGSFASDLVRHGTTLFAIDADAIETDGARVLPYDVSGSAPVPSTRFAVTTIRDTDLVDSQGAPVTATAPIGFGYFLNDLHIVSDSLGFVLVNAGGSDSAPALSNVVAFDPGTGQVLQAFNLAVPYVGGAGLTDSAGVPLPGGAFTQSGAEGLAYSQTSAAGGRLFVAMSNLLFGAPSYGAVKYPGTIQVLDVVTTSSAPLAPASLAPGVPFVVPTRGYNPVAVRVIGLPTSGLSLPRQRLLVTVAGTTGFDASGNLVATSRSSVEAFDARDGSYEGRFDLGFAGLAGVRPAFGRDAAGHEVGFFPSAVHGELYLLRLDGLLSLAIDPTRLAVLRGPGTGIPITAAQAGAPGGNLTGVALSPDGRTLAVTGFGDLFQAPPAPGQLFLLALPADVVTGSGFGADFTPGSTRFAAESGRTLGHVVLVPNDGSRPDVFVNVSGTLDAGFLGNGGASLGSLRTFGLIR